MQSTSCRLQCARAHVLFRVNFLVAPCSVWGSVCLLVLFSLVFVLVMFCFNKASLRGPGAGPAQLFVNRVLSGPAP